MSWEAYEKARGAGLPMQALQEHVKACHLAGLITPSEAASAQHGLKDASWMPEAFKQGILDAMPAAALNHLAKGCRAQADTTRRLGRQAEARQALKAAEALESAALIKPEIGEHGAVGIEASIRAQLSTTGRHLQKRQMGVAR